MAILSYQGNLFDQALANNAFRRVLFTGDNSQLVLMCLDPGEEIGLEKHKYVEQTLVCVEGEGVAEIDGEDSNFLPGDVLVITPYTQHNIKNVGRESLKLFTVYAPPNHIDGTVHLTPEDAGADKKDAKFGPG